MGYLPYSLVQGLADKSDGEDDAWNEDAEEGEEEDVKESDPLIEPFEKPKSSSSSGKAAKVVQQEAAVETEQQKEVHAEKKEPTGQVTGVCKGDEKTDCKLQATSTPSPTEPTRLPSDETPPAASDAENASNLFKFMFLHFFKLYRDAQQKHICCNVTGVVATYQVPHSR